MFHNIMAIELLVRDLTKCTAFYRDTLGLEVRESVNARVLLRPNNFDPPDHIPFPSYN